MNTTPSIGLSGFAKSGKTTAANYLEAEYGYTRLHIADPLRAMLHSLLIDFGYDYDQIHYYLEGAGKENVIPCLGVTSRHAQITLGTEWGRAQISPDLWVNCWQQRAERLTSPAMNDSVRFPNEETKIRQMNGFTIMIVRKVAGPVAFTSRLGKLAYRLTGAMWGVHPSERVDLLRPDFIVHNNGTLKQLHLMLDRVMYAVGEDYHVWNRNNPRPIEIYPDERIAGD
jgi:hypothetical protein